MSTTTASYKSVWLRYKTDPTNSELLNWFKKHHIPTIFALILQRRNVTSQEEMEKIFFGELKDTLSPLAFGEEMRKGVNRLQKAFVNKEKIVIVGDYDADGTSGTAVVIEVLSKLKKHYGFELDYMIPDRFNEGYGLNDNNIQRLVDMRPNLVITVDNGISSSKQVTALKQQNIDSIITDHHEPKAEKPLDAVAIIHPEHCHYPLENLCGCAVAYQFMKGIWEVNGKPAPEWVSHGLLDLVAIGTVCDIMELKGDNRIYVIEGMKLIMQGQRLPFQLMKQMQNWKKVDTTTLGFSIGPRINAVGRMKSAEAVVQMLTSRNATEIQTLLDEMEEHNKNRKIEQEKVVNEGMKQMENPLFKNLCVIMGNFHEGVVGIAGSKFVKTFYRPAFVLANLEDGVNSKGSARSIEGVDLFQLMQKYQHYLTSWGGHPAAAGLTLLNKHIMPFFTALDKELSALPEDVWIEKKYWEGELEGCHLSNEFFVNLLKLQPFGQGFPNITWKVKGYLVGKELDSERKVGKIHIGEKSYPFCMWSGASRVNFSEEVEVYGAWEWSDYHSAMQFVIEDVAY